MSQGRMQYVSINARKQESEQEKRLREKDEQFELKRSILKQEFTKQEEIRKFGIIAEQKTITSETGFKNVYDTVYDEKNKREQKLYELQGKLHSLEEENYFDQLLPTQTSKKYTGSSNSYSVNFSNNHYSSTTVSYFPVSKSNNRYELNEYLDSLKNQVQSLQENIENESYKTLQLQNNQKEMVLSKNTLKTSLKEMQNIEQITNCRFAKNDSILTLATSRQKETLKNLKKTKKQVEEIQDIHSEFIDQKLENRLQLKSDIKDAEKNECEIMIKIDDKNKENKELRKQIENENQKERNKLKRNQQSQFILSYIDIFDELDRTFLQGNIDDQQVLQRAQELENMDDNNNDDEGNVNFNKGTQNTKIRLSTKEDQIQQTVNTQMNNTAEIQNSQIQRTRIFTQISDKNNMTDDIQEQQIQREEIVKKIEEFSDKHTIIDNLVNKLLKFYQDIEYNHEQNTAKYQDLLTQKTQKEKILENLCYELDELEKNNAYIKDLKQNPEKEEEIDNQYDAIDAGLMDEYLKQYQLTNNKNSNNKDSTTVNIQKNDLKQLPRGTNEKLELKKSNNEKFIFRFIFNFFEIEVRYCSILQLLHLQSAGLSSTELNKYIREKIQTLKQVWKRKLDHIKHHNHQELLNPNSHMNYSPNHHSHANSQAGHNFSQETYLLSPGQHPDQRGSIFNSPIISNLVQQEGQNMLVNQDEKHGTGMALLGLIHKKHHQISLSENMSLFNKDYVAQKFIQTFKTATLEQGEKLYNEIFNNQLVFYFGTLESFDEYLVKIHEKYQNPQQAIQQALNNICELNEEAYMQFQKLFEEAKIVFVEIYKKVKQGQQDCELALSGQDNIDIEYIKNKKIQFSMSKLNKFIQETNSKIVQKLKNKKSNNHENSIDNINQKNTSEREDINAEHSQEEDQLTLVMDFIKKTKIKDIAPQTQISYEKKKQQELKEREEKQKKQVIKITDNEQEEQIVLDRERQRIKKKNEEFQEYLAKIREQKNRKNQNYQDIEGANKKQNLELISKRLHGQQSEFAKSVQNISEKQIILSKIYRLDKAQQNNSGSTLQNINLKKHQLIMGIHEDQKAYDDHYKYATQAYKIRKEESYKIKKSLNDRKFDNPLFFESMDIDSLSNNRKSQKKIKKQKKNNLKLDVINNNYLEIDKLNFVTQEQKFNLDRQKQFSQSGVFSCDSRSTKALTNVKYRLDKNNKDKQEDLKKLQLEWKQKYTPKPQTSQSHYRFHNKDNKYTTIREQEIEENYQKSMKYQQSLGLETIVINKRQTVSNQQDRRQNNKQFYNNFNNNNPDFFQSASQYQPVNFDINEIL